MFKPLKGIKVLDLTGVLAGPYCTYQLALLGAEVIKIENLEQGDLTRVGGKDQSLNSLYMGTSYLIQNSDKKSIQINLKSEKGKEIALELIKRVDIFVENMRPGKAEKVGFGWNQVDFGGMNFFLSAIFITLSILVGQSLKAKLNFLEFTLFLRKLEFFKPEI